MSDNELHVDRLGKTFYLHVRDARIQAIGDCSFRARAGSITAIAGPSGVGKSTVLKCIHRTYLPSSGAVHLRLGERSWDLAACSEHEIIDLRRDHIGFVTQFLHCLPRQSALDVVAEPLIRQGSDEATARDRAADLLRRLGIAEQLWSLAPATFSGGEKQRVNIARGFVRRNDLLLLDEPTASLDAASAERVLALIEEARDRGSIVIAIWHDQDIIDRLADQTVSIRVDAPAEITPCLSA